MAVSAISYTCQQSTVNCDINAFSVQEHLKDSRLLLQSLPMESRSKIILMLWVAIGLPADVEIPYVRILSAYVTEHQGLISV
jgi:hypothetical protein